MKKYLLGLFKYLFFKNVSILARVTNDSCISKKAKINRFAKVYDSDIGAYSYIGSGSEVVNVSVGKYCSIASGCSIGLGAHTLSFVSTSPIFTEKVNGTGTSWVGENIVQDIRSPIVIGSDVWIGNKVTIIGGVKIGHGAILGAGAIVTKDVPDYAIVVGVPAKIIRYRFSEDIISKLLELEWWNLPEGILRRNIEVFQKDNFRLDELNVLKDQNVKR